MRRSATRTFGIVTVTLLALALPWPRAAEAPEDARVPTGDEIVSRWRARLAGRHFSAEVRLSLDWAGQREDRALRVFRDDPVDAGERVLIRFSSPQDLRNLGLLYFERSDGPNDYFLYQPELRRVRRLPETIADEDVYGIDLEFLGFGGTPTTPVELVSVRPDRLGEHAVYRVEQRALAANPRFERRVLWIDRNNYVARRTEHRVGDRIQLVAETVRTETTAGIEYPVEILFRRGASGEHRVHMRVERLDFTTPIPDEFFSVVTLARRAR